MHSSTSSSERLTASDRPGVAQPVPERDIPPLPWPAIFVGALGLFMLLMVGWEWRMRTLQLTAGDLDDGPALWAEQRRRVDSEDASVVIVGDSRILFDTDLDRFQAMAGVRPVQLALPGTNARPFLENIAADEHFKGLLIVGIADLSYFRKELGLMGNALQYIAHESPSQRASFLIDRALQRVFAFMDADYRLSNLVMRLDPHSRMGAASPYYDVWKIRQSESDRQTWMWPRIETDVYLRDHARSVWRGFAGPPIAEDMIASTVEATRKAVAAIQARGGEVIFVRPPSAVPIRTNEEQRIPRARGWDALLSTAHMSGIHFEDHAAMQELVMPELSHLTRKCATVFTDAYVRELAKLTSRIQLRADAPAALTPDYCTRGNSLNP